jgi:hypothetical protein
MRFRMARSVFRWLISLMGRVRLKEMLHEGLPPRFHIPRRTMVFLSTQTYGREENLPGIHCDFNFDVSDFFLI